MIKEFQNGTTSGSTHNPLPGLVHLPPWLVLVIWIRREEHAASRNRKKKKQK